MLKKLGFGLMRMPILEEGNPKSIDEELVKKMVDYYMQEGFCYFDTAYPYHQGMSEVMAKKAVVDRYPRESFVLANKMPTFSITKSEEYQQIFDEQLQKCGVTYFDYYLLHNLGEKNYQSTLDLGGFPFMKKLKQEGKAKKIGFSFHDKAALLEKILQDHPEMEFVQLQINYVDWENESIEARKCYEVAVKYNKPVIVMEPVKGGSLAAVPPEAEKILKEYHPSMSVASWAVRYAASLEQAFMVLSGMSNFEQLQDNISFMKNFQPLQKEEQAIIDKVAEMIHNAIAIPCTACEYCVADCPKNIPIPKYFSLYNDQKQFVFGPVHANYYMNLNQTYGKSSDCIACKKCEAHCPQHIEIAAQMKEVAAVFEK